MKRTHYCGDLRGSDAGKEVVLCGWVNSRRNHGGVLFIDLRDRSGMTQVVISPENKTAFDAAETARSEYVIEVTGKVLARPEGYTNKDMSTGEIEVSATSIRILGPAKMLPIEVSDHANVLEETRLKYRYIDLRRPRMVHNLTVRHKVAQAARKYLDENGFLEIETPILAKSTPEGARDYLVPSRVNPGTFYALPQSPQMYKQLLMVSGLDRYFQLARALRDEDLRADRQPEHTQIDVEMSFVEREDDIFKIAEGLMVRIFEAVGEKVEPPFRRLDYKEAMLKYGSDKPDLRFGLEIKDCSDIFRNTGFKVFADILGTGGAIRAIAAPGGAAFGRSEMDRLTALVKTMGAKGLVWMKIKDGKIESPTAKFFTEDEMTALKTLCDAKDGDAIFLGSDKDDAVSVFMGGLRKELIKKLALKPSCKLAFAWIMHFPLLEWKPDENRFDAAHNPFTAPLPEDEHLLDTEPAKVRSHQFDLVLNGVEMSSGSIRNHRRETQEKVMAHMNYSKQDCADKFGTLLDALDCGAPPHGGFGMGLDRLVAMICGEESIREVMAFPKTASASCPLTSAPSKVDAKQLVELGISIIEKKA